MPGPGSAGPDGGPSLTSRTASGFVWGVSQAIIAKAVGLAGQLWLAKLLVKEDFGLVGLSLSVASFVSVLQYAGIQEILVARQRHLDRWRNAAFWLAAAIGLGSALLCAAAGPILAALKGDSRFVPIMLIVGATSVFTALQTIPMALLQISLRVRTYLSVTLATSAASTVVAVLLAVKGFGAYSPVLAALVVAPINVVVLWRLTRPELRLRAQFRRWRYLFGDSALLLGTGLANNLTNQGAPLILGAFRSTETVGLFYWSFNLSLQTVTLLTQNLSAVFFPMLSKLQGEPARMLAAYTRACRVLSAIGMPACFLQAALAGPLLRMLFGQKWLEAVPVTQALSIGLAFAILGGVGVAPLKAAGMFDRLLKITVGYSSFYVLCTMLGAMMGGAMSVAVATCAYYAIAGPVAAYAVVRSFGGGWRHVWSIYGPPAACAALAVGAGAASALLIPAGRWKDLASCVGIPLVAGLVYLPLAHFLLRDAVDELRARFTELVLSRVRRSKLGEPGAQP